MAFREEKLKVLFMKLAAEFLKTEGKSSSLVTITDASVSRDLENATFFVTVFPDTEEMRTLAELQTKRNDARAFFMRHTKMKAVPHVTFAIDKGEKARQRIDELLNEKKD